MAASNLQSLIYTNEGVPKLQVLDQLLIPHEKKYIDVPDVETAWNVIREMQIRGAWWVAGGWWLLALWLCAID
jgi:methylthioribose-1-phosphate isomerase